MGRQSLPLKGLALIARRATGAAFRTSVLWRFTPLDCFRGGQEQTTAGRRQSPQRWCLPTVLFDIVNLSPRAASVAAPRFAVIVRATKT